MRKRLLLLAVVIAAFAHGPLGGQEVLPTPVFQAFDNNGDPCSGCKLSIYQSGTPTPAAAYRNRARSTPHTMPIVLDAAGRRPIFLTTAQRYDLVLRSPRDVAIWSINAISFGQSNAAAVSSEGNVTIQLDSNNNDVNAELVVLNGAGEEIFKVEEDGQVTSPLQVLVADGTVTEPKLGPDAVTESKLADDACGAQAQCLVAESIQEPHYAADSIPSGAIIDGTITTDDVADGTLTKDDVGSGTPEDEDFLQIVNGVATWQPIGFGTAPAPASDHESISYSRHSNNYDLLWTGTVFATSASGGISYSISGSVGCIDDQDEDGCDGCTIRLRRFGLSDNVPVTITTFRVGGSPSSASYTLSGTESVGAGPHAVILEGSGNYVDGCRRRITASSFSVARS